ncbi:hypothetical protein TWF281_010873 [Arthrobotrys megalospora]
MGQRKDRAFENLDFWLEYESTVSATEADPSIRIWGREQGPNIIYDVYSILESNIIYLRSFYPGVDRQRIMIPQTPLSPSRELLMVHATLCKISAMQRSGLKKTIDSLMLANPWSDEDLWAEDDDEGLGDDSYSGLDLEFRDVELLAALQPKTKCKKD